MAPTYSRREPGIAAPTAWAAPHFGFMSDTDHTRDLKAELRRMAMARREALPATERIGLGGSFQAIVTGDEVRKRKPAPDVYLEAARRVGAEPSRTVAIEDSAPGIAAARAAGMRTVAIPHWLTERHDLAAADLRVTHAGELTPDRLARLVRGREKGREKGLENE